ncbi:conserved hypothetical protein [Chelatococcus asaccharovorans]|uniref:Uncharacterized protein n=1 Tax=Chelatococcus asaccharovorans TaxID=28210 RepID=A0A2V3U313_9HYPH|nr:hypothetical protein C7450_107163 [Chelatococcus asaccharovorans]CAH1673199.1 conserved hypothetical protein [Chelatococcus asaccharovorans]CAH1675410.1 conserved hypothetical protein [Chelatococcus asaccharovorans]
MVHGSPFRRYATPGMTRAEADARLSMSIGHSARYSNVPLRMTVATEK